MVNFTNSSEIEYEYEYEEISGCWVDCDLGTSIRYATAGVGLILTLVLMLMTKRKRLCPDCLNGYFALIVPVNLLEGRKKRKVVVAVCAIITLDILDTIGTKSLMTKGHPGIVKVFIKVGLVAMISVKYLPLLRCIHVTSIPTYIIGLLYTMLNLASAIVDRTPHPELPLVYLMDDLFLRIIILTVAGSYIMYWFIKRTVKLVKEGPPKETIGRYELKYVKNMLFSRAKRPPEVLVCTSATKSKLDGFKGWFRKHIYNTVPGYKYSLVILVSCTVGFIGITKTATRSMSEAMEKYFKLTALLDHYSKQKVEKVPNVIKYVIHYIDASFDGDDDDDEEIDLNALIRTQIIVLLIAFLLSVILAYILSAVLICRLLVNYRDNVLNLYRRKSDQSILRVTSMSNLKLVMSAMQFLGYQVAYLISGYIIQSGFILVALVVVFEIILFPIQFALKAFIHWILDLILPTLCVFILIKGSQRLLIKFAFLEDRAKTLAINNRRGFFITMYIVFFYNVFTGFISCIVRIIKCALIGIIMVPRLDSSLFPRWFAKYDSGYKAYSCLLHLEALQCNPIVLSFVYILLKKDVDQHSSPDCSDERVPLTVRIRVKNKRSILARNRWFVAVTLIRNPVLIYERNLFLRSVIL